MEMIPVMDLVTLSADKEKLLKACQEVGCFRLINHGMPSSLQAEMKAAVNCLFDLPDEVKHRNREVIFGSGYRGPTQLNPFFETFGIYNVASPADVDTFCSQLDATLQHREVIKSYASKLHSLAVKIAGLIAESMGVNSCLFEEWSCLLRPNKYRFTEESVGRTGVFVHTDTSFLTVLQEDECVGGLEMMDRSGTFVPVDPFPSSLLVNLGDVAKAWSNGRLHNVKHRVVCKESMPRLSIALFLLAPKDGKVESPSMLVDLDHPRLYQSFTYEDYRKLLVSTTSYVGEALSFLSTMESS